MKHLYFCSNNVILHLTFKIVEKIEVKGGWRLLERVSYFFNKNRESTLSTARS
jgi:hypothetical protein